ncbi:histidine phosphatase family protein [Gulbenkiania mobilis]|uniref:histidine phosphatase family protein n=1 Tax=Gulbenkiania mobilis TaxID=397457 RepID=UPI000A6CA5C8|nr:histidine phosphatase family protein [Gulbenkiania mobilis]
MNMHPYTLTLLRHGEIDHGGTLVGRRDLPLTDTGLLQMQESWQQLTRIAPVTAMATSPLARCRTFSVAQAVTAAVPLVVEERFAELDFGPWDGCPLSKLAEEAPDWSRRLAEGTLTVTGAETVEAFRTRVLAGFTAWMCSARGSHRVLVTHGGVIGVLLAELLDLSLESARLINVPRGGYAQLSILSGHPAYLTRLEGPCAA